MCESFFGMFGALISISLSTFVHSKLQVLDAFFDVRFAVTFFGPLCDLERGFGVLTQAFRVTSLSLCDCCLGVLDGLLLLRLVSFVLLTCRAHPLALMLLTG